MKHETRTGSSGVAQRQGRAGGARQGVGNGKPKTHAARASHNHRLKQALTDLGWQARTVIFHPHLDLIAHLLNLHAKAAHSRRQLLRQYL